MIYYSKHMHRQGAFDYLQFDVTNESCGIVLSLPMHPYLTKADVNAVYNVIEKYITN